MKGPCPRAFCCLYLAENNSTSESKGDFFQRPAVCRQWTLSGTAFPLLKMCGHAAVHLNPSFLEEKVDAGFGRFTQDEVQVRTREVWLQIGEKFVVLLS